MLAAAAGAGLVLAGCGASGSEPSEKSGGSATSAEPAGPWSFTDGLGRTVKLDQRPSRIAGLTDIVAALWNFGITPVAGFGWTAMSKDAQFEGMDLTKVAEVGGTYGEINLEKLAEARPELIVTSVYSKDPKTLLYGFKDEAQLKQVRAIAPVVAIPVVGSALDVLNETAKLAAALGVDLAGAHVTKSKRDFEQAGQALRAAGNKNLKVMCLAAYANEIYLAKAPDEPRMLYYQSLGVDFVKPGGKDYYWEKISWEQVDKYPADVILYSLRAMGPAGLSKQPTFAELPAVKAGQLYPWKYGSLDYVAQAAIMAELAGFLSRSKVVT
ncbi:ABC transporter substrate-binding protein [Flindersiella endophytica]